MKKFIFIFIISILLVTNVSADDIFLNSGEWYEGRIVEYDKNEGIVKFQVVLDGELTRGVIQFKESEIFQLIEDGKYERLSLNPVDENTKNETLEAYRERIKITKDIDSKILERTQREAQRIKEIEAKYEDKRRFERKLEHEKEMEKLKLESQKELIDFSKKKGIRPDVNIYSTNYKILP